MLWDDTNHCTTVQNLFKLVQKDSHESECAESGAER